MISASPTAAGLPEVALRRILSHASCDGRIEGGDLIDWTSHNHLGRLSQVCRSWLHPSRIALFKSVSIRGEKQARLFLDVLAKEPSLALVVKRLVIGLERSVEISEEDFGQARQSLIIVKVLLACPMVEHLQVRPLHRCIRSSLVSSIASRQLVSLVLAPRLLHGSSWSRGMWLGSDHELLLAQRLRHLEIDFWTGGPPRSSTVTATTSTPLASLSSTDPLPPSQLRLTELRIASDVPPEVLTAMLIASGPTLLILDIYSENAFEIESMSQVLKPMSNQLTFLSFIFNPEPETNSIDSLPLFDRLLPHFLSLKNLSISANDISTNVFRILPPCLEELEIQSLSEDSSFFFQERLVNDLKDERLEIPLRLLIVRDVIHMWLEEEVIKLEKACKMRGIDFLFSPDQEVR